MQVRTAPELFVLSERASGVRLVEKGSVRLKLAVNSSAAVKERVLGRGSLIGLPATISDTPDSVTAEAVTDVDLAFVSREELLDLMKRNTAVTVAVLELLSREIHDMRRVFANVADQPQDLGVTISRKPETRRKPHRPIAAYRTKLNFHLVQFRAHRDLQGGLSFMSNGLNYTSHFAYDSMGRVVNQSYCLPSQGGACNKSVSAAYDLAGNLVQLVYPDSRAVKQNFDGTNRLASVVYDNWGGQPVGTCQDFYYKDSGAVTVTVGAMSKWISYDAGSTSDSIASQLAAAFNGDSSSVVSASVSGSTVTFNAKAHGYSTDYALSSSVSYDSSELSS